MAAYIRATANISAQNTFEGYQALSEPIAYTNNRLSCVEPDYKEFIDPKMLRRMSRIIKMGVTAAMKCLQEANIKMPDAIITGTAYGCMDDTGTFLSKMIEFNEEMLSPTAFIQSTHNTVGAQIALMLQCHNYNNTFVHRGFSFESALIDAKMLLHEGTANNVLVGGLDEITGYSHVILSRFNIYRSGPVSNINLFKTSSKGTIAGEGATFFLLSGDSSVNNYARLDAIHTFYKPSNIAEIEQNISAFLTVNSIGIDEIDLVITGRNGDAKGDAIYQQLNNSVFKDLPAANYKHLCGEYPTASSFALWLAANILKTGTVHPVLLEKHKDEKEIKRILVYNHYQNTHHSLYLVSAC